MTSAPTSAGRYAIGRKLRPRHEARHSDFTNAVLAYRKLTRRLKAVKQSFPDYWAFRRALAETRKAVITSREMRFWMAHDLKEARDETLVNGMSGAVYEVVRSLSIEMQPFDAALAARILDLLRYRPRARQVFKNPTSTEFDQADIQRQITIGLEYLDKACENRDEKEGKQWHERLLQLTAEQASLPLASIDDVAILVEDIAKSTRGSANHSTARRLRRALYFIRELYLRPVVQADVDRLRAALPLAAALDEEIWSDAEAALTEIIDYLEMRELAPPRPRRGSTAWHSAQRDLSPKTS